MKNHKYLRIVIAALLFIGAYWYFNVKTQPNTAAQNTNNSEVPVYVIEVLDYVNQHHQPPDGYVGGRVFQNREGLLPKTIENQKINYQEWDVKPKKEGVNRGAERLITGSDKAAYYTQDHYKSFTKIP